MLCQIKPVTQNYDLRIRQLRPFLWSSKQAYILLELLRRDGGIEQTDLCVLFVLVDAGGEEMDCPHNA